MKLPLRERLTTPVQVVFGQRSSTLKRISIHPVAIVLALLLLLALSTAFIALLLTQDQSSSRRQIATLQHDHQQLVTKLAETEALLSLREGQIEGMQQEIMSSHHRMQAMQQRLDMFDEVLAARKVRGVHLLHPAAHWLDDRTLEYHLILVKGENYPRWIKGHLTFSATDSRGNRIVLADTKGRIRTKLEMTTHAFVEGKLMWENSEKPEQLHIKLIDHKGRLKLNAEIPISMPESPAPPPQGEQS